MCCSRPARRSLRSVSTRSRSARASATISLARARAASSASRVFVSTACWWWCAARARSPAPRAPPGERAPRPWPAAPPPTPALAEHAGRLLAERGDEVLVGGQRHGDAGAAPRDHAPAPQLTLPSHDRREIVGDEAEEGADLGLRVAALDLAEGAAGDSFRGETGIACGERGVRGVGHSLMIAPRSSTLAAPPHHPHGATRPAPRRSCRHRRPARRPRRAARP